METYTITFGDQAENHVNMQKIGRPATEGFNLEDLQRAKLWFQERGAVTEIIHLNYLLPKNVTSEDAYLLIIRDGVKCMLGDTANLFEEQQPLEKDTKALMYKKIVNKKARHNLCFGPVSQEPDYEKGKGRIVAFQDVPLLDKVRQSWVDIIGEKGDDMVAEGNYYYNKSCYIGKHGDGERRKVIAIRLGAPFPLYYQWYHKSKPISNLLEITLNGNDLYFMSSKAVGTDWKKRNSVTLRHAAGNIKK